MRAHGNTNAEAPVDQATSPCMGIQRVQQCMKRLEALSEQRHAEAEVSIEQVTGKGRR